MDLPSLSNPYFFIGLIKDTDPATYVASVVPVSNGTNSVQLIQGISIVGAFANYFGFKHCLLPEPGATVLCMQSSPDLCFIFGTIPKTDLYETVWPVRSNLGAGDTLVDSANTVGYTTSFDKTILQNLRRPTDVVPGDHTIVNELGVGIDLTQVMASLKGSELAQIKCFMLDDLTQIIGKNLDQFTALGSVRVFHDERYISCEMDMVGGEACESKGTNSNVDYTENTLFEEIPNADATDKADFYNLKLERATELSRLKVFLGKLGDVFHAFVSAPQAAHHTQDGDDEQTSPLGLFNLHVSADGGLYVRSLKEIFIQKVNFIRVPLRIRTPEDPTGATNTSLTAKENFVFDETLRFSDAPAYVTAQLTDYVNYLNEKIAYQHIYAHGKDFKTPKAYDQDTTINEGNSQIDPHTKMDLGSVVVARNSGIYWLPNGGMAIKSADGSAIIMENGNIYLQPACDLVMQPGRHLVGKVGGNTSIASRKGIDLSSTEGGFKVKADTNCYLYSDSQGVILHSNADSPYPLGPDPTTLPIETLGGVVLKSKQGIFNFAKTSIGNYADQNIVDYAKQTVTITAGSIAQLSSESSVYVQGRQAVRVESNSLVDVVSRGTVIVGGEKSTLLGQKGQALPFEFDKNAWFKGPIYGVTELSTFDVTKGSGFAPFKTAFEEREMVPFKDPTLVDDLVFRFPSQEAYTGNSVSDNFPQFQPDFVSSIYSKGVQQWTEQEVNGTLPFPGSNDVRLVCSSNQNTFVNGFPLPIENISNQASIPNPDYKFLKDYVVPIL